MKTILFSISFFAVIATHAVGSDSTSVDSLWNVTGNEARIIEKRQGQFLGVPGSLKLLDQQELQLIQPLSGNEVFRRVPGVHVVDEEGLGLRVNIGIRGLDPARSINVLMLEDGIPLALNPYGEPEMYYTPLMDRMAGVEVLKGSGQIMYGPQTIGGVVNYLTPSPSKEQTVNFSLKGGSGGFMASQLLYSNTYKNVGVLISYNRKQADQLGTSNFTINDLLLKAVMQISPKQSLTFKAELYDEQSNSTYVGLTQAMYEAGEHYTIISPSDELAVKRLSGSIQHRYRFNSSWSLNNTFFTYSTTRNWQRQDFSYSQPSNWTGTVFGDTSEAGSAIYMQNSNGHNDRTFNVLGLSSAVQGLYKIGRTNSRLDAGIRYMREVGYDHKLIGTRFDAVSGDLRNYEIRSGNAYSAYAQNKFYLGQRWALSAGVRYEQYEFTRSIYRTNYTDTSIINSSTVSQFIPGAGFNYVVSKSLNLFGGVHRGFATPRIKDAINNSGEVTQLNAELSWNTEIGMRSKLAKWLDADVTLFRMDFSNQVIPVAQSAGGSGAGAVNGGATLHQGVELGLYTDFSHYFKKLRLLFDANITALQANFAEDRFIDNGSEVINVKGNRTPYAPQLLVSSATTIGWGERSSLRINATYTGDQFTDELNTMEASNNGRTGQMDAYLVLDISYNQLLFKNRLQASISVKNLLDERYIASRRPQGIKVGLPRSIFLGLSYKL